jgi:hypothetical protein
MSPQTANETAKAVVEKKRARAAPGLNVSPIIIPPKLLGPGQKSPASPDLTKGNARALKKIKKIVGHHRRE